MSFRWVPAHCIPRYTDIHICITFEKNNVTHPEGTLEGERGNFSERSIIRCPDRTLIVYTHPKYRPLNTSFDIGIDFSVFSNNSPFGDIKVGLIAAEFSDVVDRHPFTIPKEHMFIGDCLVRDSLLLTDQGILSFKRLKELYSKGEFKKGWNSIKQISVNNNPSNKLFYCTKKKNKYTVDMGLGFQISGSLKHKLKTLRLGKIGYTCIQDLKETDEVLLAYNTRIFTKQAYDLSGYDFNSILQDHYKNLPEKITCEICGKSFEQLDSHLVFKHKLTPTQYKEKYQKETTMGRLVSIKSTFRNGKFKYFDLPKEVTEDLALFFGFYTANGRIKDDSSGSGLSICFGTNRYSAYYCKKICNKLFPSVESFIKKEISSYGTCIYYFEFELSKYLIYFFKFCGLLTGSKNKVVPHSILESPKKIQIAFLKGYFDGDGYCGKSHVEAFSVSRKLLSQIQVILLNMGIISCVNRFEQYSSVIPRDTEKKTFGFGSSLVITGKNAYKFCKHIGFINPNKYNYTPKCHYKKSKKYRFVTIKGVTYLAVKVDKITKGKKVSMFDLHFENEHAYIANGVHVHNSGGFQLRSGKLSFLDPFKVIDWFNRSSVTHGMAIDILPRFYEEDNIEIEPCLYTSKQCNNIFKNYRRKDLNLVNIIHGYTPSQKKRWADYLNDESFEGWASGTEGGNLMNCYSIMMLHDKYPRDYYHIFGIGATTNVFYLAWLGKHVKLLTSDSTTYRNSGMSREIQFMYPSGIVRMFHTGKIKEYPGNVATHIPCGCAVCNAIRYIDVYGLPSKYKTERLLTWHNMLTLHAQAQYWDKIASNSSYSEYLHTIRDSLEQTPGVKGVQSRFEKIKETLDVIEMYKNDGEAKTAKHCTTNVLGSIRNTANEVSPSVLDLFATSIREKQRARTLKSKNVSVTKCDYICVDCLPNYMSLKKLEEKFNIPLSEDEEYLRYQKILKKERKKILKEKKTLESYHRKFLRRFPNSVMKELRNQQLRRLK